MPLQQETYGNMSSSVRYPVQILPVTSTSMQRNSLNTVQYLNSTSNISIPIRIPPTSNASSIQLPASNIGMPLQISSMNTVNVSLAGQKPSANNLTISRPIANMPLQLTSIRNQSVIPSSVLQLQITPQNINQTNQQTEGSVEQNANNVPVISQSQDQTGSLPFQGNASESLGSGGLQQIQLVANNASNGNPIQLTASNLGQVRSQPRNYYYITNSSIKSTSSTDTIVNSVASTSSPIIVRKPQASSGIFLTKSGVKSTLGNKCPPIAPKLTTQSVVIQRAKGPPSIIPVSMPPSVGGKGALSCISTVKKSETALNNQENPSIIVPASHLSVPTPPNNKILFSQLQKLSSNNKIILPVNLNSNLAPKVGTYNFPIKNRQIQSEPQGNVTVLPLTSVPPLQPLSKVVHTTNINTSSTTNVPAQQTNSNENVFPTIPGTKVEPISEKEYSISIPETGVMVNDDTYTVSISDATDIRKIKKSFTIQIPEKGKSLIGKNPPEAENISASVPAILRRSNAENNDKKGNNVRRRVSICGNNDNANPKQETRYKLLSDYNVRVNENSKVCINEANNISTLYCDEELNSEGINNVQSDKDSSVQVIEIGAKPATLSVPNTHVNKDRRKSRMSSDVLHYEDNVPNMFSKQERKCISEKPEEKFAEYALDDAPGLNWNNGVAKLRGSSLEFERNEFGFIDLIDKKKNKKKDKYYRCDDCGCHGLAAEFVTPNFCSHTCQANYNRLSKREKYIAEYKKKQRKTRKTILMKKSRMGLGRYHIDTGPSKPKPIVDVEILINDENIDDSPVASKVPWICSNGFSWMKYLDYTKGTAASDKFFKEISNQKNNFQRGMKLEAIDPARPSVFSVVTVTNVQGHRLCLHFDGYHEDYDFWVNADSCEIFPVGWCEKNKRTLKPPMGYDDRQPFSWNVYLKQLKAVSAPKNLFPHADSNSGTNSFHIGMKLEAEDKKNSLTCVASIADVINNRILVHFDSWDDIYDYWVDPSSPYIHPVGWCDEHGISLTPPNSYKDPESFTWESYLEDTDSVVAPVKAFKLRAPHRFKVGMKLEAVDKRAPFLVRVATVSDVRKYQVQISFDGWPDELSYWIDDDSPDIHPVGWCFKTGHSLEPPLTEDELKVLGECGTAGCRGLGNRLSLKSTTHYTLEECPYRLPVTSPIPRDRFENLHPPAQHSEPRPREPRKVNHVTKRDQQVEKQDFVIEDIKEELNNSPKRKIDIEDDIETINLEPDTFKRVRSKSPLVIYDRAKIEDSVYHPGYLPNPNKVKPPFWGGVCLPIREILEKDSLRIDPRIWSTSDVQRFVEQVTNSKENLSLFSKHRIDGESFLMLAQDDLINILRIKLGPAMKIYNSIIQLREQVLS